MNGIALAIESGSISWSRSMRRPAASFDTQVPSVSSQLVTPPTPRSSGQSAPPVPPPPRSGPSGRCGWRAAPPRSRSPRPLPRRHADIAAGRQAPVMRLDRGAIDQLHQPFDIAQLRIRESAPEASRPAARNSAPAAAPRPPPPALRPAPCAPLFTSALSQASELARVKLLHARCRSRGPRASRQGRSAWSDRGSDPPADAAPSRAALSPALSRPRLGHAFACAAASLPKASISAVRVACAPVSSSQGSASGSFSRFSLGEGLDQVDRACRAPPRRPSSGALAASPSATACAR